MEQLQSELAEAELQLRQIRQQLDNCRVAEIPKDVKPVKGIHLFILILFMLTFLATGFILLIAEFQFATAINPFLVILGFMLIIIGAAYPARELHVPDLMVQYNEVTAKIATLQKQLKEADLNQGD